MATALRTGASRASGVPPQLPKPAASRSPRRVVNPPNSTQKLMVDMHRGVYPHLYDTEGKPKQPIQIPKPTVQSRQAGLNKTAATVLRRYKEQQMKTFYLQKLKQKGKKLAPSPPPIKKTCPHPLTTLTASQLSTLDPTGSRTRLFARSNPECARVGDILLVRQRSGDPFAGVCINIRRRGVDTAVLLRGQLTRVGVEMWFKVYSPLVEGIEVVQRKAKRARRARLTYMRKVKHDRGSVENVVRVYLRQKAALGAADGAGKKKGAAAAALGGKRKGKGKKR